MMLVARTPSRPRNAATGVNDVGTGRKTAGPSPQRQDFRRLWRAHSVSTFGDQITMVALPIAVFSRTRSAFDVGIAAAMPAVTAVLFGLIVGAVADRLRHRPVLVLTDFSRGVVLAAMAVVVAAFPKSYSLGLIYGGAFMLGVLRVLHEAAAVAVLPQLVASRDLLRANGALGASEMAGNAVGPGLAGVLITAGGPALAFATDACSFAGSGAGILKIRSLRREIERPAAGRAEASIAADVVEGIRAVVDDHWVLRGLLLIAVMNVLAVACEAQFIPYARLLLHLETWQIGIYFALGGLAGLLTAIFLRRYEDTRGDVMITGVILFALGVLVAGLEPSRLTAALAYFGAGVGSVLAVTHYYSLRQRRFPVALLGRVAMASRVVTWSTVGIALIAGGALSRAAGPALLFTVSGILGLVGAGWATSQGLWRLRIEHIVDVTS